MDYKGIDYLRGKLILKRRGVIRRYDYYEMKYLPEEPSPLIPERLKYSYRSVLG